jgi:acetylornithine/N-succinyldiaminopimelate aminotransferase
MENTNQEMDRRRRAVLTPNYSPQPIEIQRGEGCRVWDANGKVYLDLMGGIATAVLGHCHPKVMAALDKQAHLLWHASNLYATGPQVELAEKLARFSFAERFFFCNSGAEANEAALKLARRFARDRGEDRFEFVAFEGAFHGRTLFTLSATGTPAYWKGFEPLVPGFHHVPYGDLAATEGALSSQTAGIIVEPIKGENGVRPAPPGFLAGLRELANQNGCLLIMDEVQTGMGRTGPLFAHQESGAEPDIMTLAKALANGLPMGAMGATESVAASLVPGTHGSTFGGNPIAAAAACAVIDELTEGGVLEEAREIGRYLSEELQAMAERLGPSKVVESRGAGHLQALELPGKVAPVIDRCREHGVLVISAGENILRLAPPLTLTREEAQEGLSVIEKALCEG